ncbi:hypothetical protein MtrunA17_Chr8g0389761 [Medicago truncatula]|uniref:Transmembrane protein n=1 Tax=Medicago truncatula TaxID=3880 RepID=A0A396GRE4_MEDTR|nr:hypothetical protein MtrunA17_Chr8g0389761 [Medicago truncatula]
MEENEEERGRMVVSHVCSFIKGKMVISCVIWLVIHVLFQSDFAENSNEPYLQGRNTYLNLNQYVLITTLVYIYTL